MEDKLEDHLEQIDETEFIIQMKNITDEYYSLAAQGEALIEEIKVYKSKGYQIKYLKETDTGIFSYKAIKHRIGF